MEYYSERQFDTPSESDTNIRLLPGERILSVENHPVSNRTAPLSSLEQLKRLTGAANLEEIGATTPSVASLALDGNTTNEHLRLYEVLFGRDSLRVAIDLINSYPSLARTTVLKLSELQGTTYHQAREEEPGRIVHEARDPSDAIARELTATLGWEWPYYGSVDATPEFIRTLTAYVQKSEENRAFLSETYIDKDGKEQSITTALERALAWIESRQMENPHGLIEFKSAIPHGIENQVWKDSWDAYHHKDGTLANHAQSIASVEVQVTTYDALIDAAELYEDVFDNPDYARELRTRASALRETILSLFWTDDENGYFVLGLDKNEQAEYRQLKIKTSNMGHTLNSRLLKGDEPRIAHMRQSVVGHITSPALLTAGGVRTLASDEYRYREGSYHCGSVWLWDTHHIAKGLRRLGYRPQADDLDRRILEASSDTAQFPEYVRGGDERPITVNTQTIVLYDEINHRENKVEQPPQEVQAWTVAAIVATKKRLSTKNTSTAR